MEELISISVPEKILIIRLSSIGDILLTTPVIRLLKQKFPDSSIDFVIRKEFADLLVHHPAIHRLYLFDKTRNFKSLKRIKTEIKNCRHDLIIDLHKNFRSFYLTFNSRAPKIIRYRKGIVSRFFYVKFKIKIYRKIVPIYLRYLDCLVPYQIFYDHRGLDIFFDQETEKSIFHKYSDFLNMNTAPIIGVAPGANHGTKRWTIEGFSAVINDLSGVRNFKIIIFGNHADREIAQCLNIDKKQLVLNTTGELSVLETGALMTHCDLLITNDSGLLHLAAAIKKKVVAIFGSTTEELGFFPYTTEHIVVQNNNLKCRPCSHIGRNKCPEGHFKCMQEITASEVIRAVAKLLYCSRV